MNKWICYLDITSWAGISIGAEHFYAKLQGMDAEGNYQYYEVEHPLTAKEAKYLNKKAQTHGWAMYKPGAMDHRFETEASVRRWGIKLFKEKFPEAVVLLEGDASSCTVKPCLVGPPKFKEVCEKAIEAQKKCGNWSRYYSNRYEGDYETYQKIDSLFTRFLDEYAKELTNDKKEAESKNDSRTVLTTDAPALKPRRPKRTPKASA